ncbi:glutathione transferase GstA [Ramlibacter ginsenosidimutans]|uniref:Glutathione transferase GstA n=1 Tax=Ramlibacter ginsenosidimutans TaxID=502333 RepID=A0A934TRF6_9BURK|nr:glutathione transferase GstA [Ramlibacter ginsenosidimutans]MBK6005566.1 glutathione transferase GstA [Ramlibacter ginsenosidimutans]
MKLYYSPGACSLSPHIVLREAGLAFEAVMAPTKTHQLPDGTDYYTINPLGYVPLLELDDGTRLREGPAIVQYIADQVPNKNLAPANGTLPRYRLQEWLTFIGTEIHKSFSPLFNPNMPEEGKKIYRERLANRFGFVNNELAGKDYLMGDHFTVADAYLYTVTRWAKPMALDLSAFPNLQAHQQRVGARPAVQEALQVEKLA